MIGLSSASAHALGVGGSEPDGDAAHRRGEATIRVSALLGGEEIGALSGALVGVMPLGSMQTLLGEPGRVTRILVRSAPGQAATASRPSCEASPEEPDRRARRRRRHAARRGAASERAGERTVRDHRRAARVPARVQRDPADGPRAQTGDRRPAARRHPAQRDRPARRFPGAVPGCRGQRGRRGGRIPALADASPAVDRLPRRGVRDQRRDRVRSRGADRRGRGHPITCLASACRSRTFAAAAARRDLPGRRG